ncbi:MAG TPA: response regulator [Balneolaceae bacterium]|nr:response regulator [Balneolaceae bacterium]
MQLSKTEEQERHRLANDLHDNLGQLLAICKMKVSMLQKEDKNPELEEVIKLVDDAIVYTRELMSELKPPTSLEDEDLKSAIEWVAKKMAKHDLKVIVEETDHQPKPLNEEVRSTLVRSTRELLFNVVKHAGVSEAKITITRKGDQVQVMVEDEGPGFNPDERNKESLDKGFGLFSIYERMDFLDGNMDIDSEPGKGTRVTLTVPVLKGEESANEKNGVSKNTSSEQASTNQKIKILIADDHQIVREGLRKRMEEETDLTVVAEASDGDEALKLAKETSPDIIVMDVTMPKLDGITATQKIKSTLPDIQVIGLSSYEDEEFAREMMKAGAAAYLTKSEAFETLAATIRTEATAEKEL